MKKKLIIAIGAVFLAVMAGLTIYSRTSYQNSLPLVTLDIPRTASLLFHFQATSTAQLLDEDTCTVDIHIPSEDLLGDFLFYRGDSAELTFPNVAGLSETGNIKQITYKEDGVDVRVTFPVHDGVLGGDSVVVTLKKTSRELDNVLPASVLRNDGSDYVWLVKEAQGPWGTEYVVTKKYVGLLASNGEQAALSTGISLPVVLTTDKPLTEGQAVRFYP